MATPINRSQMVIGERYPNFIAITISQLLKISTPHRVYWYVSRPLSLITLVQSPNEILAGVLKTLLIMLDKVMILWKGCGFKEGASILFTAVILIRGRSNDAHYDPDLTGTMTESDESNTIMCLAHVMWRDTLRSSCDGRQLNDLWKLVWTTSHQPNLIPILKLPGRSRSLWLGLTNNFCSVSLFCFSWFLSL